MKPDINCDLGEGEAPRRTRALMRWITSANVACGGHAGNARTMDLCVRLAKQSGVRVGAHPGPWSRGDFGRGPVRLDPDELELLLLQQVGALAALARSLRVALHHVKLHGALYHASEEDARLTKCYVRVVKRCWPGAAIYARAGGRVTEAARRAGLAVREEAFADRGYREDGTLVPRGQPGALLAGVASVRERIGRWLARGEVATVSGAVIRVRAQTFCIHSDTPEAVSFARVVSRALHHTGRP